MKINLLSVFLVTGLLLTGCQNAGQLGTNKDEHNQIDVTSTYPYELQTKLEEPAPTIVEESKATASTDLGIKKSTKNKLSANVVAPAPTTALQAPVTEATLAPTLAPTPTAPTMEIKPQATAISSWQPNEVQLIRGNELISGLQRDIGRKPTALEMRKRVQSHMGLSAAQAEQLIVVLGLS